MISAVIEFEDGRVSVHTSRTKNVNTKFNAGWYEAVFDGNGNLSIRTEHLHELHEPYESKENDLVIKTIDAFFKKGIKESVEKLGFIHKLGILLYGKQGTGKSSIMNSVSKRMIDTKDAIVIYCNNYSTFEGGVSLAKSIRLIQDNPIIFIADEFDIYVRDLEHQLKNLLDGKDSVPNSLFLAATNYIEKIPYTLKERPSRFKLVLETFGIEDKRIMSDIITKISDKLKPSLFTKDELNKLFENTDSITIDEIKQMALDKLTETIIPKQIKSKIGFVTNSNRKEEQYEDEIQIPADIPLDLKSRIRKSRYTSLSLDELPIKKNNDSNI